MSNTVSSRNLTHDQKKAAEAAFRGLPADPRWSAAAREVYDGVTRALQARGGPLEAVDGGQPPADTTAEGGPSGPSDEVPQEAAGPLPESAGEPDVAQTGLPILLRNRQEAIDAGFLIDVTPEAAGLGLPFHVGLTKPMWDLAIATAQDLTEEEEGLRLRDVLIALRLRLSTAQSLLPLFEFPALLAFPPEPVPKLCSLLALVHGDSAGEQAVTLILREEVSTLMSPPQN